MQAPGRESFATKLQRGDSELLQWLHARCMRVAAPQFTAWAWEWIREDFVADLIAQLSTTVLADDFHLRGEPGAYVDTAIRNLCGRYFRELARVRLHAPIELVPDSGLRIQGEKIAAVLVVLDVRRALDQLSPRCRALVEKKYLEGQSLGAIGAEQGVPEKTIRSRLHSCREHLREIWRKLST